VPVQNLFQICLGLLSTAFLASAAEEKFSITVQAGEFDRQQTSVSFLLPAGARNSAAVRDAEGKLTPLQSDKNRRAGFVIGQLKKGAQAKYELVAANDAKPDLVQATREKSKLKISLGNRPLLEYQAEPGELPRDNIKPIFQRGGYLHPIYTLGGKIVTDDYPPNHIHHHGVWWAWTHTEFEGRSPDFWNMGDGKGRVEFVALDDSWSGPVHAGFVARHRFIDLTAPKPVNALNETWEVRVYHQTAREPFWIFDLASTQECATANALKLPEYRYGGVGFRGNWAWNGEDKTDFLTSEGETDRIKGNTARGRWCDLCGAVDGERAGIAILGHPDNFRAPQPMRLHPTEPFFCFAPQQTGGMEIAPGKPYVSRYRFVVHDGRPNPALLERLWNDYAHPPLVKVD
jgi:Family of unknown function (DUF6807)